MRDLTKQEQVAIEAVAKRFSATWEKAANSREAYLTIGGKRVTLEIATLKTRSSNKGGVGKPRLRFDKAVKRLMDRLQSSASETVPGGTTVLLTVTAPLRQWSKTAADLQARIQTLLLSQSAARDQKTTSHGNRIHIRVLRHKFKEAPKLIGFVHNPDTDPLLLLNMTRELLEVMNAESRNATAKSSDQRWLVLSSPAPSCFSETYRHIASQVRIPTRVAKVLMAFADGQVDCLAA
jgi:hypothetical protein